jgi:hypothetical protein
MEGSLLDSQPVSPIVQAIIDNKGRAIGPWLCKSYVNCFFKMLTCCEVAALFDFLLAGAVIPMVRLEVCKKYPVNTWTVLDVLR